MPKGPKQSEMEAISWAFDLEDREYGCFERGTQDNFYDPSEREALNKVLDKKAPTWDAFLILTGDYGPLVMIVCDKDGKILGSADPDTFQFTRKK